MSLRRGDRSDPATEVPTITVTSHNCERQSDRDLGQSIELWKLVYSQIVLCQVMYK